MTEVLVSVIMPAYNAERYIEESIRSVINQTYRNWELLIVNDGSTDNTGIIVEEYQKKEKRIRYFYQANAGQGMAKNLAIKESCGEYLAFLDSDDLWLEKKLELSVIEICSGNYDLIFTNSYFFEGENKDLHSLKTMGVTSNIYKGREDLLSFLNCNKIPNLTVLMKKSALLEAGDFIDIYAAEDFEMWLRLLKKGFVFKSTSLPLSLYRIHNNSLTSADRLATFETMLISKSFASQNPSYRSEINKILKVKIKNWLYNGNNNTASRFRILIKGMHPQVLSTCLYLLSSVLSYRILKKVVHKIF